MIDSDHPAARAAVEAVQEKFADRRLGEPDLIVQTILDAAIPHLVGEEEFRLVVPMRHVPGGSHPCSVTGAENAQKLANHGRHVERRTLTAWERLPPTPAADHTQPVAPNP